MKRSPKSCKSLLQKKIRINMGERRERNWSVPQALAISYSQIRRKYPECQFKKTNSPLRIKSPAKRGGLHGYSLKLSLKDRRNILDRLVKVYGYSNIIKKLNLLYVYNKNNHPENALKFRRDMLYVQRNRI